MKFSWRAVLLGSFLVFLVLGADVLVFSQKLKGEESSRPEVPVDVIAVLTGGRGRMREAIDILQKNGGTWLFISGTEAGISLDHILMANQIEELPSGLRGRIYLDSKSTSTVENAVEIRRIVERLGAKSLLLVTSRYHMRRAKSLLAKQFSKDPKIEVQIEEYSVESPNFDPNDWWTTLTGWEIVLSEYLKSRLTVD